MNSLPGGWTEATLAEIVPSDAPIIYGILQPGNQQVGQANVNGTKLRQLGIPIMPPEEQVEIARRIERAFNWIDRLASETSSARKLIDHLDQAILAKAFRGELVPQDPNDEPASVLLERIKAERVSNEVASKKKPPRRNVRPKVRLVRSRKSSGKRKARKSKT